MPPLVVLGLLAAILAPTTVAGEVSVQGTWLTGDRSDGATYSSESVAIRLGFGGRVRFRAYLPYLRIDRGDTVVWTVAGPTPVPPGNGPGNDDPGSGGGAGDGSGTGNGSGSGGTGGEPGDGSGSGNAGEDPGTGSGPGVSAATTPTVVAGETVGGLGDARVGLTARLLGGGAALHVLSAEFDVKAPTADEDEGLGTGAWDYRLGLAAEYRGWHGTVFGGVGYTDHGDPDWIVLADGVDAYVGFEAEPWLTRFVWSVWIDAAQSTVEGMSPPVLAGFGVRRDSRRPWQVSAWAGLDDDSPAFGLTFGWSPGATSWRAAPWGDRR